MSFNFGKKISNYRQKNNLTIQEMAERTKLSTAIISQIERGIGNPTYIVLESIANEMDISVSTLVSEEISNNELVLRKSERTVMHEEAGKILMYELLTERPFHNYMDMIFVELYPHGDTSGTYTVHHEEESVYIMHGCVTMEFEDEEIELHEGDTIRVLPNRKHILHNYSDEMAYIIDVKCKKSY